jgi:hypothetical protein
MESKKTSSVERTDETAVPTLSGLAKAMAFPGRMPRQEETKTTEDREWVTFNAKLRPDLADVLDHEAYRIGISRMALIQVILTQYADKEL